MSQLSIDTRFILTYLNDLGYRNITAEQLKEFIKDLRKLIKYEQRLGTATEDIPTIDDKSKNLFEKLHTTTTASYRGKLPEKIIKSSAKNISPRDKPQNHNRHSSVSKRIGSTNTKKNDNENTKNCKIINKNVNADEKIMDSCRSSRVITPSLERPSSSKMWIRPKSFNNKKTNLKSNCSKKGDPVQLYQYYKSEWDKFKPYLPGENSHSDLRWEIRNKLLGV